MSSVYRRSIENIPYDPSTDDLSALNDDEEGNEEELLTNA